MMLQYLLLTIYCLPGFWPVTPVRADRRHPEPVTIHAVSPTVFFRQENDRLVQAVDVELTSRLPLAKATVTVQASNLRFTTPLPEVAAGTSTVRLFVPDVRDTTALVFTVSHDGQVVATYPVNWVPQRHWELYVVHSSHHDLGYTDLPNRVLEEHKDHLTKAIAYCELTESWPEASRFHYVIEQAWSAMYFMEHTRDESLKQKFVRYLQNGQLEITALFGNQNTDLSGHEELNRLLYPSFRLKNRYNIPLKTAETNDMPGINWGLVPVLHGAGIRYLYAGVQDYFSWGTTVPAPWDERKVMRRDIAGAFYWMGPDSTKVLFWYGGGSLDNLWLWTPPQAEAELGQFLTRHQSNGYPYDMLLARVLGGYRDNSLPDLRHSQLIRTWNDTWAYPKIRFTTNQAFFADFEARHGSSLRTVRGDFNQTDYNIGAISTPRETGYHRANQRQVTSAETFATLAAGLTPWPYPRDQLNESYERILLYNEHCWGMQYPSGPAHLAADQPCLSGRGPDRRRAGKSAEQAGRSDQPAGRRALSGGVQPAQPYPDRCGFPAPVCFHSRWETFLSGGPALREAVGNGLAGGRSSRPETAPITGLPPGQAFPDCGPDHRPTRCPPVAGTNRPQGTGPGCCFAIGPE